MTPAAQISLSKWLVMNAESDFRELPSIVAADAIFRSPVGSKPYCEVCFDYVGLSFGIRARAAH
jgi:hypothetical protein